MKKRIHKMMKTHYSILVGLLFLLVACQKKMPQKVTVSSPDSSYVLTFQIDPKEGPVYHLKYEDSDVVSLSGLGLELAGYKGAGKEVQIEKIKSKTIKSSWKPLYGEKNEYPEEYEEKLVVLKNAPFNLRFRAYNEGVAFRYEFSGGGDSIKINNELTEFSLSPGDRAWVTSKSQGIIRDKSVLNIGSPCERPLLIKRSPSLFLAIGEASQINYSRMKLISADDSTGTLKVFLDTGSKHHNISLDKNLAPPHAQVSFKGAFNTPWRFIMAGKNAGNILENNYMILNLNEPNKLKDHSWIKPGKVIRDLTLTTAGGKAYIDFAVKHKLQYVIESAGWYGNEFTAEADASTATVDPNRSTGPLDMKEVIRYGKEKGIDIMVYVNRNQLEKQLDQILPLYQEWGIKGIKYGFVRTGGQYWTSWMHEAVRKAADYKMVLSIHDDYRPVGYTRTYPNLMTQEGIRGDEESPTNEHTIKTMFTRMIAGAGDNTICYFAPRVTEKMGSHASQLAKTVCIYSPLLWLYWYDRPENAGSSGGAGGTKSIIREVPELEFFDHVPTVWDDTKVIHSKLGELGTIARRSGNEWFIGTINGASRKDLTIPLDFLEEGKSYTAKVYFDDPAVNTITHVGIKSMEVNNSSIIKRTIEANNGLAIHIFEN